MCKTEFADQEEKNQTVMDSGSAISPSAMSPGTSSNDEPHRVKFLCSFLGSILPRPQDGKLRYVGGETRIVSVSRDIKYEELMSKMRELYEGASVLKYQQLDEDLDALVSVVNDDDVTNMMEEYDKLGSGDGFTRLRIFLFSHPDLDGSSHYVDGDERETERRYVDALNNLNDASDFRQLQQTESPHVNPLDDFHIVEPMLNMLNIEGGGLHSQRSSEIPIPQYNLHHLTIPRVGSGQIQQPVTQRYAEMDGSWSPYYSPRHHGLHDPRTYSEFPSSPSSARYRMPFGEFQDKMPEEYVRQQPNHHLGYDHQPQVSEGVVWVPAGGIPSESKGGFPGNVLHGPGVCDNCRLAFHRNQQHLEQPNLGNGFPPVPSPCPECPPNRESFMLNADPKLHHGIYLNETYGHERGWAVQHQLNTNPPRFEEGRTQVSSIGRPHEHYILDGSGTNYHVGHGNLVNGHHIPTGYVQNRTGPELPNEGVIDQVLTGGPPHLHISSAEERVLRYGNYPYPQGADSHHPVSHGLVNSQQSIWRHVPNHVPCAPTFESPGLTPQVNGTVNQALVRAPVETATRYSVGVENQSPRIDSSQRILGIEATSTSNHHIQDDLPRFVSGLSRVPSANLAVPLQFLDPSSASVHQKLDPMSGNNTLVAEVLRSEAREIFQEDQVKFSEAYDSKGVAFLETPELASDEAVTKLGQINFSPPHEDTKLSVDCLSFPPELIASVKKAALEGAEDLKAQAEISDAAEKDSEAKDADSNKSSQANAHVEPELDSDSDNQNNFKIEPTQAEAEAIARGLQTIKNDDLEEIRELGSGTYGAVYHGKWKGSDVAVKRIKASCFAGRPSERERLIADFWKEALILSSLHHPNVVSFYGIVRDGPDGSLATVTEFMINGSLKQFLQKKDRTIDRRKRLIIAMDAAFGMEYLHGKNIVHFDLKCENLLVNMRDPQRPVCKIGDLGLSKVKQHTLVSGGVRGTLPWMAPELLSGKSNMVSEKIDVYSFGIVMWELLTGEEPYADMHCASIIGGIVNNTLRPKIPPWCDPEWKALMESCWATEPAERPSFSEISQKLRNMAAAMNVK